MAIKNLVIVESPAKAKTIEGYLGKEFLVKSCYGHIRDLTKGDGAIDVRNGFKPTYEVSPEKKEVVSELRKLAGQAEIVWLASDEDREGEAISWHLVEALKLKDGQTKRIVFHEITKPAILRAVENPRSIDQNLVNAQQARRVLDRLVGFELSPVLWKKVKPSLSAGRVQSVAVRLIVEREKEIKQFEYPFNYRVSAEFANQEGKTFKAERSKRFERAEEAEAFLKLCAHADFEVERLEVKPAKKSPSAPFTTSTLQQEASLKLGYSIAQTMLLAQKLYEGGHITYMRTDSTNLSDIASEAIEKTIRANYGERYAQRRAYATKSANAQEAHEAIRPTDFAKRAVAESADIDAKAARLYDLIWKRAVASQMADAQLERTIATIAISNSPERLVAEGEVLKFDGFLKLYLASSDDEQDAETGGMLPPLKQGERLELRQMTAAQKFAKSPPRYTEASLVKKLEELGIGRPSTYAPTISTIQKRGYVTKEDREGNRRSVEIFTLERGAVTKRTEMENFGFERNKLFPSDIGTLVTEFLIKHFEQIMDYNFTATVEEEFDKIARGQMVWNAMLQEFYAPFHDTVLRTTETADRQSGERLLGKDPQTGKNVYVRLARYGPAAQIGDADDEEKKFASLRVGQSLDTITLDQALNLFKLPRVAGEFEGKEMKVAIGRFGPYVLHDGKFTSLPKGDDPYTVSAERAVEIIIAKRKAEAEKLIKQFPENPDVRILKGRWGPYLAVGKLNVRLPKNAVPEAMTFEECLTLAGAEDGDIAKVQPKTPAKATAKKTTKTTDKKAATKSAAKTSAAASAAKNGSGQKKATTKKTTK